MAYRGVAMWEVLNVLRRVGRGESKAAVARTTGHSRATVRRYVATAMELGWRPGAEEATEELAAFVAARHHPARGRSAGGVEERLLPHRARIEGWLKPRAREKRGLRLTKVHELLRRDGVEVPYSSLHRFAVKHCGFSERARVTVRMAECEPGELAEVDFGRLGLVPDPESGRRRTLRSDQVAHSRHEAGERQVGRGGAPDRSVRPEVFRAERSGRERRGELRPHRFVGLRRESRRQGPRGLGRIDSPECPCCMPSDQRRWVGQRRRKYRHGLRRPPVAERDADVTGEAGAPRPTHRRSPRELLPRVLVQRGPEQLDEGGPFGARMDGQKGAPRAICGRGRA